tara:strand:+ start:176 stop:541 length:366 start_codon:yes stop_codon:yes gene_type:complete
MNFTSIDNIIKLSESNFDIILQYIESNNIYNFEIEQLKKIEEFKIYFDENYRCKKKKFYENFNIYNSSKYKKNISEWMLNRILNMDLEDSIEKFLNSNLLIFIKKKDNYYNLKKKYSIIII